MSCAGVIGRVLCEPVAFVETDDLGEGFRLGIRLDASCDVTGLIADVSDKENDFFLQQKHTLTTSVFNYIHFFVFNIQPTNSDFKMSKEFEFKLSK